MWLSRAYGVPGLSSDEHKRLKYITPEEYRAHLVAQSRGGAVPRWNGSLLYPAKVPDLIGIKDRKYIDHTANAAQQRNRRSDALCGTGQFRRDHPVWTAQCARRGRPTSEGAAVGPVLYSLALYLQSREPPANPNPVSDSSKDGEAIFKREGCAGCHPAPLYSTNKLTLALGFQPERATPNTLDILPTSVGTDPGLALRTRKGTGYYKIPSLKGLWYRGHYLHDGSAASLEEMFDPTRLSESYKPKGYLAPGATSRAIPGHAFGLKLSPAEKMHLIAFLRTL
jgi:hypothetical protein